MSKLFSNFQFSLRGGISGVQVSPSLIDATWIPLAKDDRKTSGGRMHERFWRYWSRSSKVQPVEHTETEKSSSETCACCFFGGVFFGKLRLLFLECLGRTLSNLLSVGRPFEGIHFDVEY